MLLERLQQDYPGIKFVEGEVLVWSAKSGQLYYPKDTSDLGILHEVGHALLGHEQYFFDQELITMEISAWNKARELADKYNISLNNFTVDSNEHLDSYRNWRNTRATCPECSRGGIQGLDQLYRCPHCATTWSVPIKQSCIVRRYKKPLPQRGTVSTNI